MSAVKAWQEDVSTAHAVAWEAAQLPRASERLQGLRTLFQTLGEVANDYACPQLAARALVREAVKAYGMGRQVALILGKVGV